MSVKIRQLEIENVKRVKAVTLTPTENGLTVIGGRNGQGKTSVLDAIAWALGGNKLKPSESQRIGSAAPPSIHIELSNGLVVERKGKSSALHVIDPSGQKAGQQLLDSFIEKLALNLPKFMDARNDEKAETVAADTAIIHVVDTDETLWEIAGPVADKTGQDIREVIYQIQINNDLGPDPTLKPGQRLVIRY